MGLGFRVYDLGFRGIWGSYFNIPEAIFYLLRGTMSLNLEPLLHLSFISCVS